MAASSHLQRVCRREWPALSSLLMTRDGGLNWDRGVCCSSVKNTELGKQFPLLSASVADMPAMEAKTRKRNAFTDRPIGGKSSVSLQCWWGGPAPTCVPRFSAVAQTSARTVDSFSNGPELLVLQ